MLFLLSLEPMSALCGFNVSVILFYKYESNSNKNGKASE